jgi:hypothetical protein
MIPFKEPIQQGLSFIKKMYYHTLTEENLEKIIKMKEEELEDCETIEQQTLENLKKELADDLRQSGDFEEDEIKEMIAVTFDESEVTNGKQNTLCR